MCRAEGAGKTHVPAALSENNEEDDNKNDADDKQAGWERERQRTFSAGRNGVRIAAMSIGMGMKAKEAVGEIGNPMFRGSPHPPSRPPPGLPSQKNNSGSPEDGKPTQPQLNPSTARKKHTLDSRKQDTLDCTMPSVMSSVRDNDTARDHSMRSIFQNVKQFKHAKEGGEQELYM